MCVYIYIHTYVCVSVVCVYIYMCVCVYIYIYKQTHIYIYKQTHICLLSIFGHGHVPKYGFETSHLRLSFQRSLSAVSSCGSLYLFPSAAGGSFLDADWAKHWYRSIAEGCEESFYCYTPLYNSSLGVSLRCIAYLSLKFLATWAVSGINSICGVNFNPIR